MPMKVDLRPVTIETGSPDENGRLVLIDDRLVALLVQLEASHGESAGKWSVEWLAGSALTCPAPFADLESARRWIVDHVPVARPAL